MGQALYRRYRSKKLSELVGQEHITTALERALKKGTFAHAYLFTGPRGTGKTSVARILAHEINGLPYDEDATHLDIIEIDAASNRRIDEIRDLRDKVHIAPASAKYKVYIIDEVHMLTREAFNALLKTLEEPPAHVIFILATTEIHKLPETIISRTQRFAFKPVEKSKIVGHLKTIAKQEKIDITDDALDLIAEHGEGTFRDSISLLDQIRNTGEKITMDTVRQMLGIAPDTLLNDLANYLQAHDAPAVVVALQALQEQGYEAPNIAKQLGQLLRTQIVSGKNPLGTEQTMSLLSKLVDVPASRDPRTSLEIALLDVALTGAPQTPQATPEKPAPNPEPKTMKEEVRPKPEAQVEPHPSTFQKAQKEEEAKKEVDKSTQTQASVPFNNEAWQKILANVKQKHNTLFSLVRSANPLFGDGELTIECAYAFHKKRLNESRNKQVIIDTIKEVTGQEVGITFTVAEAGTKPPGVQLPAPEPTKGTETVKTVSNIFGGAELLES